MFLYLGIVLNPLQLQYLELILYCKRKQRCFARCPTREVLAYLSAQEIWTISKCIKFKEIQRLKGIMKARFHVPTRVRGGSAQKTTSYHLYAVLKIVISNHMTQPMLQLKRRIKTQKEICLSYQLVNDAVAAPLALMDGNRSEKELQPRFKRKTTHEDRVQEKFNEWKPVRKETLAALEEEDNTEEPHEDCVQEK